ncbi:MAG: hypothetical protein ABEK02_09260 [Haloquadratum sp.]
MQPLQFLVPIDALEGVSSLLPLVVFLFALANLVTRHVQHDRHQRQAETGDEDEKLSRWPPHTATNVGLVFSSFLYMIVEPHGGMVMSVLALGVFFSDFFEYESRRVEARSKSKDITAPKAAIGASVFALLYAGYESLFFLIKPIWSAII